MKGPNGRIQKVMAMAMAGGFGADLDLSEKGGYTITSKVVSDAGKLIDDFSDTLP